MKETAGKMMARNWFYRNYLPSILGPRSLRTSNFLVLIGEDFRELPLLEELEVPLYRVFSVERDQEIYAKQRSKARREELDIVLHFGDLSGYIQDYLRTDHRISVFNLDICGSYLSGIDPALGKLLLFARRNPSTVMATYSSAARDRAQLMEGLKSLVVLLWLAPEATDKLVRHLYSQYQSAALKGNERSRNEVSANMLLRHMLWLRSHMEHILIGSYSLDMTAYESACRILSGQEQIWQKFVAHATFPLTYEAIVKWILEIEEPNLKDVRMDVSFGDVQFLTYAANNGFYQNCYFATYEHDGSTISLGNWLVESAKNLRSNRIVIVDSDGKQYPTTFGRVAVHTDKAVLWSKDDLMPELRHLALPPPAVLEQMTEDSPEVPSIDDMELTPDTIKQIHELARKGLNSREISEKLSLKLPMPKIAAQVATARRKSP